MANIIKQDNPLSKKQIARKKWLIIIVVVILVVGGGVGGWLYLSKSDSKKPAINVPIVTRTTDQIQQITVAADAKANSGDVSGGQAAYDAAVQQTSNPDQKSYLLIGEASLYYDAGNYDQALVLAKQAESYKLDENVASMMAEMYKMKGDKQNAIIYYQKSISLIDKANPIDDNTQYYQNEIDALNGVNK